MNLKHRFIPGVDKDRLRQSLSKKKLSRTPIKEERKDSPQQEKNFSIDYEVPSVKMVIEAFEREIVKPIAFHEDVLNSRNPPKCMLHNNILTLYCLNDNKPLCAGCLYSNQLHKTHKVVPLTKAGTEIKEDLGLNLMASKKGVTYVQQLVKMNEDNLVKIQKEYPEMIEKIHDFYLSLHERLVEKKNQQLQIVAQNWARLRFTYNLKRLQLQKIGTFMKVRLQSANDKSSKQHQLHFRNIALELSKIKNIICPDFGKEEENRFKKDLDGFSEILTIVNNHLVFTNLYSLQKEIKGLNNTQKGRNNLLTSKKYQKKFLTSKSPLRKSIMTQQNQTSLGSEVQKGSSSLQRCFSKNRHSRSDLLKKWSLQEERRLREKSQIRLKNNEFHSLIIQKSQKNILKKEMTKMILQKKQKNKSHR